MDEIKLYNIFNIVRSKLKGKRINRLKLDNIIRANFKTDDTMFNLEYDFYEKFFIYNVKMKNDEISLICIDYIIVRDNFNIAKVDIAIDGMYLIK